MKQLRKETIPVRPGEELHRDDVEQFLRKQIPDLPEGSLEVEQFAAGHSNLTYLLRIGDWEAVLRRPPIGPVAPKTHDMEREYRILSLMHKVYPLAPKPYVFNNDLRVMEAPFYVMERRKGIVIDRTWPEEADSSSETRRLVSEAFVDTLVELHAVDWEGAGLASIGHPSGYMERQVHGWIQRYERAKTDELPLVEENAKWLIDRLPLSPAATIIHNDFKLNNLIFSLQDLGKVEAVVDWEMTTIGDPLSDLAVAVSYWAEADDAELTENGFSPVTTLPGFINRHEFMELYAKKSGRDLHAFDYYMAFAYFKVAVICQQIYFRWKNGQTQDPRFERLDKMAISLMERTHGIVKDGF